MVNVYVFDITSIYFHGKEHSDNLRSIKNTENNLTMKQMFDMSEKLIVGQSDEIYGVNTINWEDSSWRQLSLVNDEEIISLSHAKVYVCSDSVLCLGKMNQNRQSNTDWENKLTWFKSSPQYRTLDTIDGEPMEFEWNIAKDSLHCSSSTKSKNLSKMCKQPEEFAGRIIFMSMFNDISWRSKDNKQECESSAQLFSLYAKRFGAGQCHSSDLHQKRSGILLVKSKPQGKCDRVAELMMLEFSESGHQISMPRVHCPEERSKAKEVENYQYTFVLIRERLKLFFAQLILLVSSVFYGAVSDLCEECKACHVRTGRLALAGQSDPLFEPTSSLMETPTPLTDDPAQEDQFQKYQERVERLSQQIRVIEFCTDAGFLTTVDVGQYFMTKDTEEFSQFTVIQWLVVSTLCQEMKNPLTRMVGFEGTPKLCLYWKSQPATYKVHMEWKIRL